MEKLLEAILKLDTEERRRLLEAVWDSVEKEEAESAVPMGEQTPDWQIELVRKRMEADKQNPEPTISWPELKNELLQGL
jgi:putative addiction module component (TIGR02574 family)